MKKTAYFLCFAFIFISLFGCQKSEIELNDESFGTCEVSILCSSINENLDKLKEEKSKFVPKNGVILQNAQVQFSFGDTVFEVIKKACSENICNDACSYCEVGSIQIEYTYTPAFNNYYIEGIHQLYEKDCGSLSGWMYSVNGEFPNVGVSGYEVKDGDKIVFLYTCNMGEDIGNSY